MIKAVFWDFGGVITSSPFESFNRFEKENDLPKDFLRSVNSTNPDSNAWAHAFESGLVEFTERRKSFGKSFSFSNLLKDSKGLLVITPPKSQKTALII